MWDGLQTLLAQNGLMPHGHCLLWRPYLLYLHVASDLVTGVSYYSIPVAIAYFVKRRQDLRFRSVFVLFAIFILACGTTHLLGVWTMWQPIYGIHSVVKAATALVSAAAAVLLWWLVPKALALPSPAELESANRHLQREILERKAAEDEIRHLNATLETRVAERTEALKLLNEHLSQEIRERRQVEASLRQAAAVFENTHEGVMITDAEGRIVSVNRAFVQLTGYDEREVMGQTPHLLHSGHHDQSFYDAMWEALNREGYWQGEIWNRRKNGETFPELLTISAVRNAEGEVTSYVGAFSDISHIKASEAKLEYIAHHDLLTGLPNRRLFESRLEHALKAAQRHRQALAVLMLDLDRFKDINDSFGHAAGDNLLKKVAARFENRLRQEDTLARFGGDEFAVLIERLDNPEVAGRIAHDLIESLGTPIRLDDGPEVAIGASIGISQFPEHGIACHALMEYADAALYQAKAEGRHTFRYYTEALTHAARERLSMEARLRKALESQELAVYYQPQIDLRSGRIIGAEALLRWQDPENGLILPSQFINVAEETGLIGNLGDWALQAACLQAKAWSDQGLPAIRLAVNVSPRQFVNPHLSAQIVAILAKTGFDPRHLQIEVTEQALMNAGNRAIATLRKLKELGIHLTIDNFGSGHFSLAALRRLPLDCLTIDREFIRGVPHIRDDSNIATAIIQLAHTLGLDVLAEGVETEEQLNFLKGQNCDYYQGFFSSAPLTVDAFTRLLRTQPAATSEAGTPRRNSGNAP